ncbi:hypothetical protein PVAP13_2KG115100 [Panicum virgatum]|uniref:Uncharacterized protein n=1 Tax=Panicum virgatum TaxID=38727 RepID=A0A8T0W0A3_PANVG|nr:hypothetical protein PVAP13_2KG115100 [Panicum virgatum]
MRSRIRRGWQLTMVRSSFAHLQALRRTVIPLQSKSVVQLDSVVAPLLPSGCSTEFRWTRPLQPQKYIFLDNLELLDEMATRKLLMASFCPHSSDIKLEKCMLLPFDCELDSNRNYSCHLS